MTSHDPGRGGGPNQNTSRNQQPADDGRTVRARCPIHGPVNLPAHTVTLNVPDGVYTFSCPACATGDVIVRDAQPAVIALLHTAHVPYVPAASLFDTEVSRLEWEYAMPAHEGGRP